MTQIPRGPENLFCPDWRKPMSKVCHTCPLWMKLPINDTNGTPIDDWRCAKVWSALLQFHQCQETFSVSTEINQLRNETKKAHDETIAVGAIAVQRASDAVRATITQMSGFKDEGGPLRLTEIK